VHASRLRVRPRAGAGGRLPSPASPSRTVLLLVAGAAGILAYRPVLMAPGRSGLAGGAEHWVFDAGSVPPALLILVSVGLVARIWREPPGGPPNDARVRATGWLLASVGLFAWATVTSAPDLLPLSLWSAGLGWGLWLRGSADFRRLQWAFAPALFALLLPGPLRNALLDVLQQGMARSLAGTLALLGVAVERSGEMLWIDAVEPFAVIETCSGLRSAEGLAIVALIRISLRDRQGWRAWALLLVAPPIALALNLVRLLVSALAPATTRDPALHTLLALAVLLLGVVCLLAVDARLARSERSSSIPSPAGSTRRWPAVGLCAWALLLAAIGQVRSVPEPSRWPLLPLSATSLGPLAPGNPEAPAPSPLPPERWALGTIALHQSLSLRYADPSGPPIDLWIAVGDPRLRGASAISPRLSRPDFAFETREREFLTLGAAGTVVEQRFGSQRGRPVLSFSWHAGVHGLATESWRAFTGLDRAGWVHRPPLLFARVSTPCDGSDGRAGAEQRLQTFWAALEPRLTALSQAGKTRFGQNDDRGGFAAGASNSPTPY